MVQQEHRISYDGGEATQESLQNNAPHHGLGIAELEKLRREEPQKTFSSRTELVFHPIYPHPNTSIPFIPGFDPSSPFGYDVENLPMSRFQLPYSSPPISSDGTMPLLWSSFQGDTSPSCSNSQFPFVPSALTQPRWDPQLLLPLQKHDLQQQISQEDHSSLHSIPGGGLQLALELPSSQNRYGIMNTSSFSKTLQFLS